VGAVAAYLRDGGSVIATGDTGACDAELQLRRPPGLAAIAGERLPVEYCTLRNPSFEEGAVTDDTGVPGPIGWQAEGTVPGQVVRPSEAYGWSAPDGCRVWQTAPASPGQPRTRVSQDTDTVIQNGASYTFRASVSCLSAGKGGKLALYAWRGIGGEVQRTELATSEVEGPVTGTFRSVAVTWRSRNAGHTGQRLGVSADVGHGFLDHCTLTATMGPSLAIRRRVGAGRLVYFPGSPERDHWQRNPRDLARIPRVTPPAAPPSAVVSALRWAWSRRQSVEARAATTTLILPWRQPDRLLVHLVNLNACPDGTVLTPDRRIHLSLALPPGREAQGVTMVSPDRPGDRPLTDWQTSHGRLEAVLPELLTYTVAVVDLAPAAELIGRHPTNQSR
jgi:hypothetical protein